MAQGALLQRSSGMCVPTLRCYDLPSPGMRWSVVANGRVTVTLQQLLPWWLLSPVTLRPRGSDSEDSDPSEKGQILNCCLCGTAPAILSTVSYARQPTATRDFLWGFSRWRWRESGDRTTSLLPGVSPPEIPCEGIFFFSFPSTPSSWRLARASHSLLSPVCPLTVPGLSVSCSKHDRSLCPISVIDVSK